MNKQKSKLQTCRVCRRRKPSVKQHSIELYRNGDDGELIADVEAWLCGACADRVADALADVVTRVRADHVSEVTSC